MKTLRSSWRLLGGTAMLILSTASIVCAQSGSFDWNKAPGLGSYAGIKLADVSITSPRKMTAHCMQIDTTTPGLRFTTTPRCSSWEADKAEVQRHTTRKFIKESQSTDKKIVAAINSNFFTPWPAPNDAETVGCVNGLAVSEGELVSPGDGGVSFLAAKDATVSMAMTDADFKISNIQTAVSGCPFFVLKDGVPENLGDTSLFARTALGISKDNRYVYFLAIDAHQPNSEGATTDDDGTWLKYFGAYVGLNLDGGGSTTMAWWDPSVAGADKSVLISCPRVRGLSKDPDASEKATNADKNTSAVNTIAIERSVGNNIGVYYTNK